MSQRTLNLLVDAAKAIDLEIAAIEEDLSKLVRIRDDLLELSNSVAERGGAPQTDSTRSSEVACQPSVVESEDAPIQTKGRLSARKKSILAELWKAGETDVGKLASHPGILASRGLVNRAIDELLSDGLIFREHSGSGSTPLSAGKLAIIIKLWNEGHTDIELLSKDHALNCGEELVRDAVQKLIEKGTIQAPTDNSDDGDIDDESPVEESSCDLSALEGLEFSEGVGGLDNVAYILELIKDGMSPWGVAEEVGIKENIVRGVWFTLYDNKLCDYPPQAWNEVNSGKGPSVGSSKLPFKVEA